MNANSPNDGRDADSLRFLVGPTASGKSALALELAERAGAAIVSMDSMLVYRGMDVGTAKPSPAERERTPHFAIDLAEPSERYDVQRYLGDFDAALEGVRAAGLRPLVVGGTGFYLMALVHGLFGGPPVDAELRAALEERARVEGSPALHSELAKLDTRSAERIHPNDVRRVVRALEVWRQTGQTLSDWQREWGWHGDAAGARPHHIAGLAVRPEVLEARIRHRAADMLASGWIEEALAIREGPGFGPTAIQALGYREVLQHADGELDRAELEDLVALRTRQFARRQGTWFRRFSRTTWVDPEEGSCVENVLRALGW